MKDREENCKHRTNTISRPNHSSTHRRFHGISKVRLATQRTFAHASLCLSSTNLLLSLAFCLPPLYFLLSLAADRLCWILNTQALHMVAAIVFLVLVFFSWPSMLTTRALRCDTTDLDAAIVAFRQEWVDVHNACYFLAKRRLVADVGLLLTWPVLYPWIRELVQHEMGRSWWRYLRGKFCKIMKWLDLIWDGGISEAKREALSEGMKNQCGSVYDQHLDPVPWYRGQKMNIWNITAVIVLTWLQFVLLHQDPVLTTISKPTIQRLW